jgi:hypothetical protein
MNELGILVAEALAWFPHEQEEPFVLIRVPPEQSAAWASALGEPLRRCYITDEELRQRAAELEEELGGTHEERQRLVIRSKLPDPGATMAGDFGEVVVFCYQATTARPEAALGPKKWRLKQDRNKPAPYSDVIHLILPRWPTATEHDAILCSEVKTKSTDGNSAPIQAAIDDCVKDRTSRLAKTLVWLRDRALGQNLGTIQISHLNRFINASDYPPASKRFRAVAVICSTVAETELEKVPAELSEEYTLTLIVVPNLQDLYTEVFEAALDAVVPDRE